MNKLDTFIRWYFPIVFVYLALSGYLFDKGGIFSHFFGASLAILSVLFSLNYVKFNKLWTPVFLFILYLGILIIFSSNFLYSLKVYSTSIIPMLLLPLSFYSIDSIQKFSKLSKFIFGLVILYLINIGISTIFNLGGKTYGQDLFETGNIFTEGLNSTAYILVLVPLIINLRPKSKLFILIVSIIAFIIILVQFKRISIIALTVGYIILILGYKRKLNIILGLILAVAVLYLTLPIFQDMYESQFIARERRLNPEYYEEEARYQETLIVWNEIIKSDKLTTFLFGKEMFNSPGNYAGGIYGNRQLHSDYNVLLHGSGVVGLIFFIFWQLNIFFHFMKWRNPATKSVKRNTLSNLLRITFISIFIMGFVISISGGINLMLSNAIRYVILGALLRIQYNQQFKQTYDFPVSIT